MSFFKVFNKKLMIGLTVLAVGGVSAFYGLKSKASDNQKEKDYYEDLYEIGMDEPTEEDIDWASENVVQIESPEEFYDFIEDCEIEQVYNDEDVAEKDADEEFDISSYVDNSKSKYFPPIEDQGSGLGACVSYSQVYYLFTYTYNKAYDIESKGEEHLFSPMWSWNQVAKNGVPVTRLLKEKGCVTMAEDQMVKRSSEIDKGKAKAYNYYADADLQRAALNRRITGEYSFSHNFGNTITGPDAEMLQPIKAALSNGEILSVTTYMDNWRFEDIEYSDSDSNYKGTSNKKYKKQHICGRCDIGKHGGHRLTLVGYDDNIWLDINHNGIKEKAEMGAFKLANSYGKYWSDGNDGFIWLSYDALNTVSQTEYNPDYDINLSTRDKALWDFAGYVVRTEYPKQYAQFTIVSDDVKEIDGTIIAEDGAGNPNNYNVFVLHRTTSNYADPKNNGSKEINKGFDSFGQREGTFVVALDNVIPDVNSTSLKKYTWKMRFNDDANEVPMTIKDVKIIDEATNKEYKDIIGTEVVKNGEDKDIIMDVIDTDNIPVNKVNTTTIYYSGYKYPNIHYCIDGQNWTNVPGVQMATNFDVYGFDHVAVIDLGKAKGVTVCFNDGNNNWDSNNGNNYRFGKGTYTYKNGVITQIDDPDSKEYGVKIIPSEYCSIGSGNKVKFTAECYGMDKATASYSFSYTRKEDTNVRELSVNSSNNTTTLTMRPADIYDIKVKVTDGLGNEAVGYLHNFNVSYLILTSGVLTDVATPVKEGNSVNLNVKAIFLCDNAYTDYKITDESGKETTIKSKNGLGATWTPTEKGTYKIQGFVHSGGYYTKTSVITFEVLEAEKKLTLENVRFANSDLVYGDHQTVFADISGGKLPYGITIGYYNKDNEKTTISSFTSSSSLFTGYIVPPAMEKVTFYMDVEDADGNKVSKEFNATFKKFKITNVVTEPADSVKLGETVVFKDKTENERIYKAPNTRMYIITNKDTNESETLYSNYSDTPWTPAKAGNYDITL
ncbi:MAG: hypothetical protein K6G26_04085, partial [Lachnospiraceae bacterium]|nr:hypothetical protein [Lachnospiraceae bacterium]